MRSPDRKDLFRGDIDPNDDWSRLPRDPMRELISRLLQGRLEELQRSFSDGISIAFSMVEEKASPDALADVAELEGEVEEAETLIRQYLAALDTELQNTRFSLERGQSRTNNSILETVIQEVSQFALQRYHEYLAERVMLLGYREAHRQELLELRHEIGALSGTSLPALSDSPLAFHNSPVDSAKDFLRKGKKKGPTKSPPPTATEKREGEPLDSLLVTEGRICRRYNIAGRLLEKNEDRFERVLISLVSLCEIIHEFEDCIFLDTPTLLGPAKTLANELSLLVSSPAFDEHFSDAIKDEVHGQAASCREIFLSRLQAQGIL